MPDPSHRRRRPFRMDREKLAESILARVQTALDERQEWMRARTRRYAKFRGWLESESVPFEGASDAHIPLLMADSLRAKAGLFNAVIGNRPVMEPVTLRQEHRERAERSRDLIEYQFFHEANGEHLIETFVSNLLDDGTAVAHTHWARVRQTVRDVRVVPRPDLPFSEAFPILFEEVVFAGQPMQKITRLDEEGFRWEVVIGQEREAKTISVNVFEIGEDTDDAAPHDLELILEWTDTVFDGPSSQVLELEDVIAPSRSENFQPVTPDNPGGSPWAAVYARVSVDEVRRLRKQGTYDLLTAKDMEALEGTAAERKPSTLAATAGERDALREAKDTQAGIEPQPSTGADRDWVTIIRWYGRHDADGDGLEEDVIIWVVEETKTIVRARWLTELFPGLPIRRPLAEARLIPVPGQLYGIGLLELGEGLHDFLHQVLNYTVDSGLLANLPWGGYRAASGLKPEVHRIQPGELIPLDTPQTDIQLFQWQGRDLSWGLNMAGFAIQMLDRLISIGPIQQGQVPTGKASALRTVGTTMAILQQGAALPEQMLRRLFQGLAAIWEMYHRLNVRFLPRRKEFLIAGKPAAQEDAYGIIEEPGQLDVPVSFGFQATLLNTNKGLVAQALTAIGAAIVSPLAIQLGLVDAERIYNWAKDLVSAYQQDPARYLKRPPGTPEGPRLMAEEAISLLIEGQLPQGMPMEPPQEHLEKLRQFMQSPEFGLVRNPAIVQQYIQSVIQLVQQEAAMQALLQSAQSLSQTLSQGQGGGAPTTVASPALQTEAPTSVEAQGGAEGGSQ